jgi:hypothetical protein
MPVRRTASASVLRRRELGASSQAATSRSVSQPPVDPPRGYMSALYQAASRPDRNAVQ